MHQGDLLFLKHASKNICEADKEGSKASKETTTINTWKKYPT